MAFGTVNVPGVTAKELRDVSDIANAAKVAAEGVQDIANSAQSTANAALERANAADTNANAAKSTADEALEKATTNEGTIGEIRQAAAAALDAANAAKRDAGTAKTAAENAQKAAEDAAKAITDLNSTINIVPTQNGALYYTGAVQSPSWNGLDTSKLTLGGTTSGTNVGTYEATVTPKEGFKWPDGTTTAKTIQWTIQRAVISVPTAKAAQTYTGGELTGQFTGYDTSKMTIGGTSKATNVGTYSASFTPGANFQWPDGTTTAKTVSWSIAKAAGSLSLNKTSLSLNAGAMSGTIGVTRAGDGTISATSSNTSVATVSVSGSNVTVTAKGKGSATITVKVAAGTNHLAPADKTCSVTVTLPTNTLNDNSWSTIKQVSDAGTGASYWAVGDTKTITINGTVGSFGISNLSVQAFILGFNHNSGKEGANRIHFQIGKISGKMVALCDNNYGSGVSGDGYFHMNSSNTNVGGWKDSYMRKTLLGNSKTPTSPVANSLMAALPSDLRSCMKSVTKYTDNVGNNTGHVAGNVTATTDYLFLLSNYEVQGNDGYANNTEKNSQAQYAYYKAGNSKIAYRHTSTASAVWWWLRSPTCGSNNSFCVVNTDGYYTNIGAYASGGLLPGFAV